MHINKIGLLALSLLAATPMCAIAEAGGAMQMLTDKTQLQLGGYHPKIDSGLSIHGSNDRAGTDVDMESDLGMADAKTSLWLTANYRFADRHRVGFSYFNLNRDASHTLERSLDVGDQTYLLGMQAHGKLDIDVAMLDYNYLFAKADNYEAFVSAGLHRIAVSTQIGVDGSVSNGSGGSSSASFETTVRSVNAPLPVVGVGGTYVFNDSWAVTGNARYFGLNLDTLDGSLSVIEAAVQYHPWRNVGFSLGYTFDRLDFDLNKNGWTGSARYDFKGATFAVISHF